MTTGRRTTYIRCVVGVLAAAVATSFLPQAAESKKRLPLTRVVAGPVLFRVVDTPDDFYTAPQYLMAVRLSRYPADRDSPTYARSTLGDYSFYDEAPEPDIATMLNNRKCVLMLVGRDLPEPGLNKLRIGERATVVLRPLTPELGKGFARLGPRRVRHPRLGITGQDLAEAIPAIRSIGCPKPTNADYTGYPGYVPR